jgi:hypothetical protein
MTRGWTQAQAGLTYIESMLGVLLLAVCLAPILQAIGNNISRHGSLQDSERDVRCLLRIKERVYAEPFGNLLAVATSTHVGGVFLFPTSYSEAPTAACPLQHNVYILRYNPTLTDPFAAVHDEMLYVRVEQAGGASTATLAIKQ